MAKMPIKSDDQSDVDDGIPATGKRGDKDIRVSRYGAMQAVDSLTPTYLFEVFDDTPEEDINELINGIDEWIDEWSGDVKYVQDMQGEIKDLSYKREILKSIIRSREQDE